MTLAADLLAPSEPEEHPPRPPAVRRRDADIRKARARHDPLDAVEFADAPDLGEGLGDEGNPLLPAAA